jgi:hypothetical protein
MNTSHSDALVLYASILSIQILLSILFSKKVHILFVRIILYLPLLLFVLLGSAVGTDASVYQNYYEDVSRNGCGSFELEPLFCLSSWLYSAFLGPEATRNFFAITIWLLLVSLRLSSRATYLYLSIVFMPVFFLDASMNGVRQGLAISLFLFIHRLDFSADLATKSRSILRSISIFSTVAVHQSIVFAVAIYSRLNLVDLALKRLLLLLLLLAIIALSFNPPPFLIRFFSYSASSSTTSFFSGFPILILIVYQLRLFLRGNLISSFNFQFLFVISVVLLLLSKVLGLYSFIRLLNLLFLLTVSVPLLASKSNISFSSCYYSLFTVFIFWILRFKDFYSELSLPVSTPFLDYQL